jgi:type II secretory pathway component PulF
MTTSFVYQAQSADGRAFSGTLDASSADDAARQLQSLQLRPSLIEPVDKPPAGRAVFRTDDFLAFNQQLAHLTAGGLPIERSLRLLAAEMRNKSSNRAVEQIVAELEKGVPLGAAFTHHRGSFPPLYGKLLDAGVRSNNLSGMLLNLGRHVAVLQRLRAALWRATTYPIAVLTVLLLVLIFIWFFLMPGLESVGVGVTVQRNSWGMTWLDTTSTVTPSIPFLVAQWVSFAVMAFIAIALLSFATLAMWSRFSVGMRATEPLVLWLPLVGPILRWNLIARWCDALHLGVQAGLDLPAAISLAEDAIDSPRLKRDSRLLAETVSAGQTLDQLLSTRLLPALIPTTLQMGIEKNDLADATAVLARMYQEQADVRLAVLPQVLSPLLLMLVAVCVGLAVAAALMPLISVLQAFMR